MESVKEIIESLGGPKTSSHFFNVTIAYIYQWINSNKIPSNMLLKLYCYCQKSPFISLKINGKTYTYEVTDLLDNTVPQKEPVYKKYTVKHEQGM